MTKDRALPPRVFQKGRWFYHVRAEGPRRVWERLSRVADGLPAMHMAYAKLLGAAAVPDAFGPLCAAWLQEVSAERADQVHRTDESRCDVLCQRFADFRAADVTPPDVVEFLKGYRDRPRTHNAYRALVRELMRFAIEKGYREPGSNPVEEVIRTMPTPARTRLVSDSELRRVKVAAIARRRSKVDGRVIENKSGRMLCAVVDMAYLTGQAIGDLLRLEWSAVKADGILFARRKVEKTTGSRVIIGWTPALAALVERLRAMRKERRAFGARLFVKEDGQPYTYHGIRSAWDRSCERAGVVDAHIHDLKARALTDKEEREGMRAASAMGQHSTEAQTADYVRRKAARKTSATR